MFVMPNSYHCGRIFSPHPTTINTPYILIAALSKVCGGVVNDTEGMIVSPDYDHNKYTDHNLDCRWKVVAQEHKVIFLWFLKVQLEYSLKCKYDFIRVSTGSS